jgi:adenylate cyclase
VLAPSSNRFEQESQISPTTAVPRTDTSNSISSNISPRDHRISDFANYRRDLSVLETSGNRNTIPQIQHNPPTAASPNQVAPWATNGPLVMPSSVFGTSFYDSESDNLSQGSQLSPGFRPGTGRTGNTISSESPDAVVYDDERRPSLASVTTASSSGSKSSVVRTGINKKLHNIFGDDYPGGKDGSNSSLPAQGVGKEQRSNSYSRHRDRTSSSITEIAARDTSPGPSRPRTPVPSSDVVPFLYQDSQVWNISMFCPTLY